MCVALACVLVLAASPHELRQAGKVHGVHVYVSRHCGPEDGESNRMVVVQLFTGGRIALNADTVSERELPDLTRRIMERRVERALWVVGEDGVEYGRVVSVIESLKAAVPGMATVLLREVDGEHALDDACFSYQQDAAANR